jgi:LacI family transcriptional regulator
MGARVSQQAIAEAVGVSKNAVSLALAGKQGVSEETRQRILAAAKALGYEAKPRRISVRKRTGATPAIGMFIRDQYVEEQQFFGPLLAKLQHLVATKGHHTYVHALSSADENQERLPPWLEENDLGAIVVVSKIRTEYLQRLARSAPLLLVDHYDPLVETDAVLTDNVVGAYLATEHLWSHGHRRIGFLGYFFRSGAPANYERAFGYQMAMAVLAEEPLPALVHWLEDEHDEVAIGRFVEGLAHPPTAWFCANDLIAFHLVRCLGDRGIDVPSQVSVIGFDDLPYATLSMPAITTVRVDTSQYAVRSVERLAWRLEHRSHPVERITLRPALLQRDSVGDAPVAPEPPSVK